ncbi:glycine cleavage system T protein [Nemania diffusa]|nr:glycine cleavage system T protein [Nemania diffusa]
MKFPRVVSTVAGKGIRIRIRTLHSSRNALSPTTIVPAFSSSSVAVTNGAVNTATATGSITTTKPQQTRPTCLHPRHYQRNLTLQPRSHRTYASSSSSNAPLNRTALYDLHLAHGAKMVPFGGFEMPVQYSGLSVSASHHFTREKASLFDVGHMVQHRFEGPGATAFLQRITPASLEALPAHQSTLSALLWPKTGGIVDDTIITRLGPEIFYVVTNAACREKDLAYLGEQLAAWGGAEVRHEVLEGFGLVALQGPLAEELLTQVLEDPAGTNLRELYFGQSTFARLKGAAEPALISRGGYTGEDGFEIMLAPADTVAATSTLLAAAGPERLQLAGLGARDSLRLEAGMCLYGHDLDDSTTPVEGSLAWIIGRDRRDPALPEPAKFHGADVVLAQLTPKSKGGSGVAGRRVGLIVDGAPAREHAEIVSADGKGDSLGVVTSGCPSPTLGKNIAMGYVRDGMHKAGTEVNVLVRNRPRKAVVTKMPFVPTKYWKGPPSA